jgi:hypothetical protein
LVLFVLFVHLLFFPPCWFVPILSSPSMVFPSPSWYDFKRTTTGRLRPSILDGVWHYNRLTHRPGMTLKEPLPASDKGPWWSYDIIKDSQEYNEVNLKDSAILDDHGIN